MHRLLGHVILVVGLLAVGAACATAPAPGLGGPPTVSMSARTKAQIGAAWAVLQRDEWVHSGIVVVLSPDGAAFLPLGPKDAQPTPTSLFEIGSVTKVFTAIMLQSLVDQRVVTLDTPLSDLLPDGTGVPRHAAAATRPITLELLATHSSGLPRLPHDFEPKDPRNPYAHLTTDIVYRSLSYSSLESIPGTRVAYSNFGMGLLGHVLARVSHMTYEALMQKLIAGPLGMKDTVIALDAAHKARLWPGSNADGVSVGAWDLPVLEGAGAIRSTAQDMTRFMAANLTSAPPLGAVLERAQLARTSLGEKTTMALGWQLSADGARWHNGMTGGHAAFLAIDRGKRVAVLVLADRASTAVDGFAVQAFAIARGAQPEPLTLPVLTQVPADELVVHVGTYTFGDGSKADIVADEGKLFMVSEGQERVRLWPSSRNEFSVRLLEATVVFDGGGGLVLSVGYEEFKAQRQAPVDQSMTGPAQP